MGLTRRRRGRWLPKFLLAAAVTVLAGEAASYVALLSLEGRRPDLGAIAAERRRLAAAVPAAGAEAAVTAAFPIDLDDEAARLASWVETPIVLHPYLGYVADPDQAPRPPRATWPVNRLGFFGVLPDPAADEVVVGVFGGSVATALAWEGREALLAALDEAPGWRGRTVRIAPFALPGYRQPQQLHALAYLLTAGVRPDVVVNLDGFNEVVLGWRHHRDGRVSLLYPRGWRVLAGGLQDPAGLRRVAERARLEEARRDLARAFSTPALRHGFTPALTWRALDRRLAREEVAAEETLAAVPRTETRYLVRGPAMSYADDAAFFHHVAEVWATSSRQMAGLCAVNHLSYVHLLQPNQYFPGSKPMGRAERATAYNPRQRFRHAVEAAYPLLREKGEALRRQGVAFHDLTRLFAERDEPVYLDDCCHLDRRGNELLGAAVAAAVLEEVPAAPPRRTHRSP